MIKKLRLGMLFAAFFMAGLSTIPSALAIIGETPEESELRYGVALKNGPDWKFYKKAGFDIRVHFSSGLTDQVIYKKNLRDKEGRLEDFSFDEIAVLLDNNSQGSKWENLEKGYETAEFKQRRWKCEKIPIEAYYDDEELTLTVFATDENKIQKIYKVHPKVNQERLLNTFGV